MFIMLYACAGVTFWSESESCGKQFFEDKNMIGNIFEKKYIVGKFEKSDIYEDLSHQKARKSYRRVSMWCH